MSAVLSKREIDRRSFHPELVDDGQKYSRVSPILHVALILGIATLAWPFLAAAMLNAP